MRKNAIKFKTVGISEKDAKIQYEEWYLAHQFCKFQGSGKFAMEVQDDLRMYIKDKEFLAKYDLRRVRFENKIILSNEPRKYITND